MHFLYLILATIQSCLFWASVLKDTLNDYLPKHTHNVLWAGSANHLSGMLKGIIWPEGSTGEVWGSRQAMHESDQKSSVKDCGGQAVEVRLWWSGCGGQTQKGVTKGHTVAVKRKILHLESGVWDFPLLYLLLLPGPLSGKSYTDRPS